MVTTQHAAHLIAKHHLGYVPKVGALSRSEKRRHPLALLCVR
jgi:hypothetical protein